MIRNAYRYDKDAASIETAISMGDQESRTRQEFKDECDINVIWKRFGQGYKLPENWRKPEFGDFTGISDFHKAANAIATANESFDQLSADVRAFFNNDPGKFVDFAIDSKNRDQMIEWGLIRKPETRDRDGKVLPVPMPPASAPIALQQATEPTAGIEVSSVPKGGSKAG